MEETIWIEDSRVKLVFDRVFACTTSGRRVRWFNAEETEEEEDAEEGGGRGSRRGPEDRREAGGEESRVVSCEGKAGGGNMDGQDGQDGQEEGGEMGEVKERRAKRKGRGRGGIDGGHGGGCARRAQAPLCKREVSGRGLCFTGPGASASGSNGARRVSVRRVGWHWIALHNPPLPGQRNWRELWRGESVVARCAWRGATGKDQETLKGRSRAE